MSNLFKKVAVFTDLHVGLKSNSATHLRDCEEYVDWFIEQAQQQGCETCIFMGDWSHNRNSLNLITLNTSLELLEKLGAAFEQFFWFPGNHDLFYKDKRDIHSSAFGRHIPGVTVVEKVTTLGDVTLVPWLVGDEWKAMKDVKSKYIFGHFELPLFYMNAMVQMPDHGELKAEDFNGPDYIFSGHFHKRQSKGRVHYIGNAFAHNFADSWDDDRGMMVLEWGGEPTYFNWPDAPKYRVIKLSDLIDRADEVMKSKMNLKVHLDIDISYEEANFIKETFISDYDIREISLIQDKTNLEGTIEDNPDQKFESVDQIVIEQLVNIDSEQFDKNILLEIYNSI
jgi:DNA repair exonuclease SbcCD nuclease subunit